MGEDVGGGFKVGEGFDFLMQCIFWNNLFTGKNLLKQARFIEIALVIFRIFKMVISTNLPWNSTQSKSDANGVKGKNGRVHWIKFSGLPSKMFHNFLNSRESVFAFAWKKLLLSRSFLFRCLFKNFIDVCLALKNWQSKNEQHGCKLRRIGYTSNIPKRDNTYS